MLTQSIRDIQKPRIQGKGSFRERVCRPKLTKVIVHRSLGIKAQDSKVLKQCIEEFRLITGQQPVLTRAKKSIAAFKVRKNMVTGLKVTLRGQKMYAFVDKLIHLVLPQVKDFQGLNLRQFDEFGNYHLGFTDQGVFPELEVDFQELKLGLEVSFITSVVDSDKARQLFTDMGFVFQTKR